MGFGQRAAIATPAALIAVLDSVIIEAYNRAFREVRKRTARSVTMMGRLTHVPLMAAAVFAVACAFPSASAQEAKTNWRQYLNDFAPLLFTDAGP